MSGIISVALLAASAALGTRAQEKLSAPLGFGALVLYVIAIIFAVLGMKDAALRR